MILVKRARAQIAALYVAAAILLLQASAALATVYTATGIVVITRIHDTPYGADRDWFSLEGVSSMGTCATYDGRVAFRLRDDQKGQRQFAAVLAAKMAGATLAVTADDTKKDGVAYCYVQYMD